MIPRDQSVCALTHCWNCTMFPCEHALRFGVPLLSRPQLRSWYRLCGLVAVRMDACHPHSKPHPRYHVSRQPTRSGTPVLASWAGVSPGNNESAGKKKGTRTAKGNKGLKAVLSQAAWASSKKKDCRIASFFYRVQKRRGQKKATIATAHLILRIAYHVLKERVPYHEVGWDYLPNRDRTLSYWIKKLEARGFKVSLEPTDAA